MSWIRISILYIFISFTYIPVFGQTFKCDGSLILSAVTNNTTPYKIVFGPFGAVYYSPITSYQNEHFDALGFNPKDNYIYGVLENTNSIVRLRANGTYEVVGETTLVNTLQSFAGDCSPDGLYLCHENELDKILVFDVVDNFQLVDQIDLFWSPFSSNTGPFTTRIDDFAIDPNNPNVAYAFQARHSGEDYEPAVTKGNLLKINLDFSDPDLGMVTPIGAIPASTVLELSSLFFTAGGQLYGYGPYTTGPYVLNRFISIDPFSVATDIQGISTPSAAMSDGCSCPYSLSFVNNMSPRSVTCSSSTLDFSLSIVNRSNEPLVDLLLTDTLPDGIVISSVSDEFDGNIVEETGVGTNILVINNLNVAARSGAVINFSVDIVDIPVGFTSNQAYLTNLPSLFGGSMLSDDPQTVGYVGDASQFDVSPQPIDNILIDVTHPSNCLDANDGQIKVSSPILLIGENYKVKLRNQSWEEYNYDIIVNNEHAFVLDSLMPGKYHLAEVRPVNSECSFGWRETDILIEAPNEQLQVTATSNSPICEGFALELNANLIPGGEVYWRGPGPYGSVDWNSVIDSAQNKNSGVFEMIATYGACEQIREIDVLVAEKINASISGKIEYCERENMLLEAEGNGDLTAFTWQGPNGLVGAAKALEVASVAPVNDGEYQVVINNGYCKDSATTTIAVLPSPTISLPKLVETDFCHPVNLTANIYGNTDVTYSWIPNSGLSCYDCPSPELLPPFLPNYRLSVINDYLCADTSFVQVSLKKEDVIYAPNVFSPNFDGFNDRFQLYPSCGVATMKNLIIVDRWGAVVYSKKVINPLDPQDFWDGFIDNKIGELDAYIWQVELELVDGRSLTLFGDVSLVR